MSGDAWEASMSKALTRHNTRLRWLKEDFARAGQLLEAAKKMQEETRLKMESEIEDSENEQKKILSRRNDPVVYVRKTNEDYIAVYHGSLQCGWFPAGYREVILGDAQDAGLRPCYSCGHLTARPEAA
jgi:hypothetical protein